jgi:hypothetical protein
MTKLIVVFHDFANAPKYGAGMEHLTSPIAMSSLGFGWFSHYIFNVYCTRYGSTGNYASFMESNDLLQCLKIGY